MIKRYCDICGEEVKRDYVSDRLKFWDSKMGIEITLGLDGTWNAGNFCLMCIQRTINKVIDKKRTEERTI